MKNAIAVAAKAWVAAITAALAATLPAVQDASNDFLVAAVTAVIGGAAVYLVPNKPAS